MDRKRAARSALTEPPSRAGAGSPAAGALVLLSTILGSLMLVGCAAEQAEQPVDLVLRGGTVYIAGAAPSLVGSVAIRNGRIAYVGDDAGVEPMMGPATRVVELAGRMIAPGFHDSHMHPMSGGLRLLRCRLDGLGWPDEAARAVRECAEGLDDGEWLVATGLTGDAFDGRGPARELLDELAPGRPAYVATGEGFTAWANSPALDAAGVGAATPDPEHGRIERDPETGAPSGTLRGSAVELVRSRVPRPSAATYREALRRASEMAHRLGITSVIDASVDPDMLEAYRRADDAGELTLRVVASQRIDRTRGVEQVDELVARAREIHSPRLRADAAKIFLDGDFPDHTAALLEPYADAPGDRGDLLIPAERLNELVLRLDARGVQIHVHAMGDRAIRTALAALEGAVKTNPPWPRRHHLAHLGLLRLNEVPWFRLLGVAANIQPMWAQADDVIAETELVLGPERARMLYPFASLFRSGAVVVAGSDWPSISMSPLDAIQVALTRRPLDGSGRAWIPEQRVRLREILSAYTRSGAWLAGRLDDTGTVEVGKAADLVVLDRNLVEVEPHEIGGVRVLLTLLDGSVVWESEELEHPAHGAASSPSDDHAHDVTGKESP